MEKSRFVEYFRKIKYYTYEMLLSIVNTLGYVKSILMVIMK